jgi:hypothetical protein
MGGTRHVHGLRGLVAGLGLATLALTGCQTWYGGMTLPSGQYLKHRPQYFPTEPRFPLQREVDSMADPDGLLRRGAGGAAPAIAPAAVPANPVPAVGGAAPAAGGAAPANPAPMGK